MVLETTQQGVDVTPYNKFKYEPETNIPIVKAATAYTTPTGVTYILVLNQALYFPELDHSLLNPNQMRVNGVVVDDCPRHLSDPSKPSTHSIFFPEHDVRIPLEMGGVISRFSTRRPTSEELEHCLWLPLTGDLEWDPYASSFAENERNISEESMYHQPQNRGEAMDLLVKFPDAKILAGGTFVINTLKLLKKRGLKTPSHIISLKKIKYKFGTRVN
jgi:hypothetical protein